MSPAPPPLRPGRGDRPPDPGAGQRRVWPLLFDRHRPHQAARQAGRRARQARRAHDARQGGRPRPPARAFRRRLSRHRAGHRGALARPRAHHHRPSPGRPRRLLAGAFPTGAAALKELAFGGSDDARARRPRPTQIDGSRGHLRLRHRRPRAAAGHPARPRRPGGRRSAPQGLRLSHAGSEAARRALSHLRRTAHPAGRDQLHQGHLRDRLGAAWRPARRQLPAAPARPHPERPYSRGPPARARRLLARGGLR